jgi:hypothetical protein
MSPIHLVLNGPHGPDHPPTRTRGRYSGVRPDHTPTRTIDDQQQRFKICFSPYPGNRVR